MGSMSWVHWLVVIAVFLLLFGGRGKISDLMGDVAQGIKSFKKGMSEDDTAKTEAKDEPVPTIENGTPMPGDLKSRAETERRVEGSTS
ncbi:MAG TPA: twin-arginine translocase TatA/TatE family subunit [Xanthobacteraceae bacterium]|nr:twin-arginine translocase TatA/TatE family subunit [Xanthobacteraceae bacterium]